MSCPKCSGLIGNRYDTMTCAWERYCINCGHLPDLVCFRKDGADRDAVLLCAKCKKAPQCTITDGYGRVHQNTRLRFCVTCRIEHTEKIRMAQVKRRNAKNRKAGLGNIRVRRVA